MYIDLEEMRNDGWGVHIDKGGIEITPYNSSNDVKWFDETMVAIVKAINLSPLSENEKEQVTGSAMRELQYQAFRKYFR